MSKSHEDFLYGVNLGGWLIVEKWMTPSLFVGTEAVDEYTLAQSEIGQQRLIAHRQQFITEADIQWLAEHGVNALRVPVGYWVLDGVFDSQVRQASSVEQLDDLMAWASAYGMNVLLDLHGAVGSQNGKDHSGRVGSVDWRRGDNQTKTIAALETIVKRYRDNPALWGIELINEPQRGKLGWRLMRWYRRAYRAVRKNARPGTYTVFSDAYAPWLLTGALRQRRHFPVAMDVHFYQIFGAKDKTRTVAEQIQFAAKHRHRQIKWLQHWQPLVIGEWSGALPQSASAEQTRAYIAAQQQSFAASLGWFYWTYKLEGGGAWNFRQLIENGNFPLVVLSSDRYNKTN